MGRLLVLAWMIYRMECANLSGFYLITTDILGPYGSGFAMGTLGWGPGKSSSVNGYWLKSS